MSRPYRLVARLLCVGGLFCTANPSHAQQPIVRDDGPLVVLVGDATVSDQAGWGRAFAACLRDGVRCSNLAREGHSSSSCRDEGLWDDSLALEPDWVLIQFGHNDEPQRAGKQDAAVAADRANLERYVEEARRAGARPVLVTPLSRRQWGSEAESAARIVSSLEPYARAASGVAAAVGAPLIDLHGRSVEVYESLGARGCEMISPASESGQLDASRLNQSGAVLFGAMVAMDCRSYIPEMADCFRTSKLAALQQANPPPAIGPRVDGRRLRQAGPLTPKGAHRFRVARDGTGDFRTLQEAIRAAPDNNADRTTIRIGPGVYIGQTVIPADKPNLTLVGAGREKTILSYALTVHDPLPPGVVVLADGFRATNLTIRQMAGDHGQAIALRIDGDRAVLRDCDLLGWQDTLRLERGRHYLLDCHVEGRVDYIYGGGTAVLERCTLLTKGEGYVTAASTPADQAWGYVFLDCDVKGTGPEEVYLGRPWRPHASVSFVNCHMDDSVKPEGWNNWRNPDNERTARYLESGCTGPGAAPAARVAWSRQLMPQELGSVSARSVLGGSDDWDPAEAARQLMADAVD